MFLNPALTGLVRTIGLAVLLWGGAGGLASLAAGVTVEAIRFGRDPGRTGTGKTRIVLDLSAVVPFSSHLTADHRGLIVSLTGVDWHPPPTLALRGVMPLVAYRFEPGSDNVGQVTIQADQPLRILSSWTLPPNAGTRSYRIIIDLMQDAAIPAPAASEPVAAPEPTAVTAPQPIPQSAPQSAAQPAPQSVLDRGLRAALGQDGPPDYSAAAEAFRSAAAAGSPEAAFNLGELYRNGRGVPQDYRQAAQWFAKSADAGFAPAQFYLAVLMFNGVGAVRDQRQATALLEKAAGQGLPQARRALDDLHRAEGTPDSQADPMAR